ncbi:MAG: GAF domain-containing sensor histidine kinase [Chloroflexi bacterium]|nr:GAF domain-containing sensor histidine kinase [Chloroflexota bacterium]
MRTRLESLKWAAIVIPLLVLFTIEALRHIFFVALLHTLPGFIATFAVLTVGIVAFSFTIFGLISKLQASLNEKNRQLSALNAINLASTRNVGIDEVLETGLDQVLSVMRADAGLICHVDKEREEHTARCHRGFSAGLVQSIQRAKLRDDSIAQQVVRTGKPVVLEHVLDNPQVREAALRENVKSAISAPLKSEGEVNGVLVVATHSERHFTQSELQFLRAIGGQLGLLIRNVVLFEQTKQKNLELAALVGVGKAVSSSLDLDQILPKSLDAIFQVTAADAAEVWLKDDEGLIMKCHRGSHVEAFLEKARFAIGEGLPGIAAQQNSPLLVHNLPSDSRFLRSGIKAAGFHTFCALPLRYQERLVGVLTVAAKSADAIRESSHIRLLEAVGERLSVAIVNAELHKQVQDTAVLKERERIAHEMHDGMAQVLGYINTQVLAIKKLVDTGQLIYAREELSKMEDISRDLYADVREGIMDLRTASRQAGNFLSSLREYTRNYSEMSGIPVKIESIKETECEGLTPSAEIQLMRIIQEALTNIRKHSKAVCAGIKFERRNGDLHVVIYDNGQGFDMAHLPPTGRPRFGLRTMRERAEAIGGALNIHSSRGNGTTVEARLPTNEKDV